MGKFILSQLKEKIGLKRRLFNTIAPHAIQIEQSTYQGAIDNLQNSVLKKQLSKKTFNFVTEFYDKSLINNKTFKKGLAPDGTPWENYVGDKKLYNKAVKYLPTLLEHKSLLDDEDCEFIELTLIPLLQSLKFEVLSSRVKTWQEVDGEGKE